MNAAPPTSTGPSATFAHTAVVIDSDQTLRTVLVPELQRSLRARLPVFMVVSDHTAALLGSELAAAGTDVQRGDPDAFYQRLGFAYEGFRRYLAEQHAAGRRVHVIAEPDIAADLDRDTPVDRAAAYLAYESVCNDTYAPYGCPVTCIWDTRRHPGAHIAEVRKVHTHELTRAGRIPSRTYLSPDKYLAGRDDIPLDDPPEDNDHDLRFDDVTQLSLLRSALRSSITHDAFTEQAADDVLVAVTEVATNGLAHGAAPVRVRIWHHGTILVVQVDDSGGYPLPTGAGYRRPERADALGGRGLWLARQLADTVTTHSRPRRTSVRLHFPPEVTNRNPT